jgi:hypothetical protein
MMVSAASPAAGLVKCGKIEKNFHRLIEFKNATDSLYFI